jgi:hypothetical protein
MATERGAPSGGIIYSSIHDSCMGTIDVLVYYCWGPSLIRDASAEKGFQSKEHIEYLVSRFFQVGACL